MSSTCASGSSRTSSAPSARTPSCTSPSSATSAATPRVRHEVNVLGTKRLLEYCVAYGVKRVVVLSSAYVYGALPDNPYYMDEDYPLNVSRTYPEMRDLAEVDTLATAFLWRHPEIATTILRPVEHARLLRAQRHRRATCASATCRRSWASTR